jgi:hypothetical protein
MLKNSTCNEKVEAQDKVEAQMSLSDFHSTSTSACLPADVHRWVLA